MTTHSKFHFALATLLTTVGTAGVAFAEETEMVVDPGATSHLNVLVNLSSPFGSDTDTDSVVTSITSSVMRANPTPDAGPFNDLQMLDHDIATSGGSLYFEFYCSFIGCVASMDVTVHSLSVSLVDTQSGGVDGSGHWALPTAVYEMDLTMTYTSGLLGDGDLSYTGEAAAALTGDVELVDGILVVSGLEMAPIHVDIPDEDLPSGISSLGITVDADFSQLIYRGNYGSNVCDLDGDGFVNGADLTMLLGGWGNCCTGDIDKSGSVDGADLTMLLGCWTG